MSSRNRATAVLIVMLLVTLLASLYLGLPRIDDTPPLSLALPSTVGDWRGSVPLFCQEEACMNVIWDAEDGDIPETCSECDGPLASTSLPELRILPEGTRVGKMVYRRGRESISVSVVLTGSQRSGIHRPEWCLPSQGLSIQRSRLVSCSVADGSVLPITILDVAQRGRAMGGGLFAYWFSDGNHETATHWRRLYWMAHNDLLLGVRRPWGYVSVWMPGRPGEDIEMRLLPFVKALYPPLNARSDPVTVTEGRGVN